MSLSWLHIRRCRAQRRLADPRTLADLLEKPCADPVLQAQVAAELVGRAWLLSRGTESCASPEFECMERGLRALHLPGDGIAAAVDWCHRQRDARTYAPPPSLAEEISSGIFAQLVFDLENWQSAQGFVLLVPRRQCAESFYARDGVALPFILDDSVTARSRLVRAANDEPVGDEAMHRAVTVAHALGMQRSWTKPERVQAIKLTSIVGGAALPIEGGSIGFAALLALALRAQGETDPFACGASGALDGNGCLAPHACMSGDLLAKERLLIRMGVARRFLPAGPTYRAADTVSVPIAGVAESLARALATCGPASPQPGGPGTPNLEEIQAALANVDRGMAYGSLPGAAAKQTCEAVLSQLSGLNSWRALDRRMEAMVLLASAECHLGHPERASEACERVLAEPRCGARFKARILVRQAVNLTDRAQYRWAVEESTQAASLIPNLSTATEQLEMQLQTTGSRGQALAFWAMLEPEHEQGAFDALKEACDLAKELDEGRDGPDDNRDLPRDLAYWYLAHALLRPERAETVYGEVRDVCLSDPKTHPYLLRHRWLNAYRLMLRGLALPESLTDLTMAMPDPDAAEGWPNRTAAKYRGALRTARGDMEGARADFAVAAKLVQDGGKSPLLEFIGATALLQAGESLRHAAPEEARGLLLQAREIFTRRGNWFQGPIAGRVWLAHTDALLAGSPPPEPSPQLFYPY